MLTWLRRYLIVLTLMFWLGGFTFYGTVVLPIGRAEFDGEFSLVTAPVAMVFNVAAAVTLLILAWDGFRCRDRLGWRRRGRWVTWIMAAVCLLALFGLHFWLRHLMADGEVSLSDPVFAPVHRAYLWIGATQWLAMMVFIGLMLASWRAEDRQSAPVAPTGSPSAAAPPLGTA